MDTFNVKNVENNFILSIIELDFHHDSLDGLIKIFDDSNYQIHVFTTKKNISLLSGVAYSKFTVFHPLDSISKFCFLRKNKNIINSSNIVFINTIGSDYGSYLAINKNLNTILRVHNINKTFNPNKSVFLPNSLFTCWKFFSYIFRQVLVKGFPLFRRIMINRLKYFTFPDDGLRDYVLSNKYIHPEKVIASIPLKVFASPLEHCVFSDELVVSIIGATDNKRRYYEPVIKALKDIYVNKNSNAKIKLILLGKVYGKYGTQILEELNEIKNTNFTLKYFQSSVQETEFIDVMNHTHVIVSPIIEHARAEIYHETYGKTKTSGSILDFIKFGIVTFTPDYYNSPADMKDFILKYSDEFSLSNQLLSFVKNPELLNNLNAKAKTFVSTKYSKKEVFNLCETTFKKIIEH